METTDPRFAVGHIRVRPLQVSGIPRLQAFFEANPAYFVAANGEPARPEPQRTSVGFTSRMRWSM